MSHLRIFMGSRRAGKLAAQEARYPGSTPLDPSSFAPDRMPANVAPSALALQAAARRVPEPPVVADPWKTEKWAPRTHRGAE